MICGICAGKTAGRARYHAACLKKLFGVEAMPKIELKHSQLAAEARKLAGRLSISGVQPKVSVRLNKPDGKLEVVAEGGRYILKPQSEAFERLPENEFACTALARTMGIRTAGFAAAELSDGRFVYIVRRFDRTDDGGKIHAEDFAQILGKSDKYSGSMEEIGRTLKEISDVPGLDAQLFFERALFYYLIGNGDAHMKNFSVIYDPSGAARLAPAYDIVSSKIVIPEEDETALAVNGRRNNIGRKDFESLARYLGINQKFADKLFSKYLSPKTAALVPELDADVSGRIKNVIRHRIRKLS